MKRAALLSASLALSFAPAAAQRPPIQEAQVPPPVTQNPAQPRLPPRWQPSQGPAQPPPQPQPQPQPQGVTSGQPPGFTSGQDLLQSPGQDAAPHVAVQYPGRQGYARPGYPGPEYPGQGYPPQGYPPQGYPPQGYQARGYPPQGYPPQGYPPQGYSGPAYPGQGYAGPGYPRPAYSGQANPGPADPGQGYAAQGYPGSGYPGSGPPGQGNPEQRPRANGAQTLGQDPDEPQAATADGPPDQPAPPLESKPAQSPPVDTRQPQWPNRWLPAKGARIQALDKVNAQATTLTVKVGQPVTFGSLTIAVKACVVRPADQPSDAAAYLDVSDSHPDQPGFDGWMLANEPAVSMMQNPIYDLRVAGCA